MTPQILKDMKRDLVKLTKANKSLCVGYPDHFEQYYSTLNCKVYLHSDNGELRAVILHPKNVDPNELKYARNNLIYTCKGIDPKYVFTSQFTPRKDTK